MSYVNAQFTAAVGTPVIIPVNRWSRPGVTVQLTSSGTGTVLVEGTTRLINRGETAVWATIDDIGGNAITALADPALIETAKIPLEAIRITATTATVTGTVMQSGD